MSGKTPITLLNMVESDFDRIRYVLTTFGLCCSDSEVAELQRRLSPVDFDRRRIAFVALQSVAFDWRGKSEIERTVILGEVRSKWYQFLQSDPNLGILLCRSATWCLDEHPHWWAEIPCACKVCRLNRKLSPYTTPLKLLRESGT